MEDVQEAFDLSIVFISHDMGVIREVCDRVAVMYLGEIVELAPTEELFSNPQHPYTRALLGSIPQPDPRQRGQGVRLTGDVPSPSNPPAGCRFHTRCPEIIQPEGYDFEQEAWRSVMDFRVRLRQREIDLDAVRRFLGDEAAVENPNLVEDSEVEAAIREEFGIPDQLSDASAETVLSEAFEWVVDGDLAAADDLLADEFETVCEREAPELAETEAGHPASCHLHEQGEAVEQPASADD
jgi:peptide/nickel transport system ATP-binding protein